MRFLVAGGCLVLMLLSGCGEEGVSSQGQVKASRPLASVPDQAFIKNAIALGQGRPLVFDGRIVRYDLIRNAHGAFDRYAIESSKSLMGLEAEMFAELARKGYTRRVRQETPERFLVHYLRKGGATVIADYRAKKNSSKLQRLVVIVRADK